MSKPIDVCPVDLSPAELERLMLLFAPMPRLPSCEPLAPRFPILTFFVRMLAVRHPDMAAVCCEMLSLYAMGWHCHGSPPDSTIDFVDFVAAGVAGDEANDRLFQFENMFTLRLRDDPALRDRYARKPGAVVLDV